MIKRSILLFMLLTLLLSAALCACTEQTAPTLPQTSAPTDTLPAEQQQRPPAQGAGGLVGVWENSGQYGDGQSFVETLTLAADGTAQIHLVYQNADYQNLTGSYVSGDGVLTVSLTNDDGQYEEIYDYTVDGDRLTLTNESGSVSYTKVG